MTRLVIFDLDGTLVNAYPAVAKSVNFTLKKLGFPPKTFNEIKRSVGWGDRQLVAQFVGEKLADQAIKFYRPHHLKALKSGVHFLPGAKNLILWCKSKGVKIAIATNRPTQFTRTILSSLGVITEFDVILCADKAKRPKPYPDMLLEIGHRFKISKKETFFIGDMTIDLKCGARAGIRTIAVSTGSNTKKELIECRPYKIISQLKQLKTII